MKAVVSVASYRFVALEILKDSGIPDPIIDYGLSWHVNCSYF